MQEAWRAYLGLALGATEASRKKATKAVRQLVGKGGATAEQVQTLAGELVATGLANREAVTKLVRYEVDRALGRVGLATADEVRELTARVRDLERRLRGAGATPAVDGRAGSGPPTDASMAHEVPPRGAVSLPVARKVVAKKAVAKKAVARKAVAKKAVAKRADEHGDADE
jgi:polyhydroxyalkanoate synthesis regulator phasin